MTKLTDPRYKIIIPSDSQNSKPTDKTKRKTNKRQNNTLVVKTDKLTQARTRDKNRQNRRMVKTSEKNRRVKRQTKA